MLQATTCITSLIDTKYLQNAETEYSYLEVSDMAESVRLLIVKNSNVTFFGKEKENVI